MQSQPLFRPFFQSALQMLLQFLLWPKDHRKSQLVALFSKSASESQLYHSHILSYRRFFLFYQAIYLFFESISFLFCNVMPWHKQKVISPSVTGSFAFNLYVPGATSRGTIHGIPNSPVLVVLARSSVISTPNSSK